MRRNSWEVTVAAAAAAALFTSLYSVVNSLCVH